MDDVRRLRAGGAFQSVWCFSARGSDGKDEIAPACSPDEKYVYFMDRATGEIKRVLLEGGRQSGMWISSGVRRDQGIIANLPKSTQNQ